MKIFHKINFFLIIIYILLQFKTIYWFPLEISMDNWYSDALLFVNGPPQCIAIDLRSIGLKKTTKQFGGQ